MGMSAKLTAEVTGAGAIKVHRAGLDGKARSMEFAMAIEAFDTACRKWMDGALIQDAFPMLDANQREFLKTGITPDEWDAMFKEDEDDDRHQECDGCGGDTGHKVGFCEACEAERKESLAAHGVTAETLLRELVDYQRAQFDGPEDEDLSVSGADTVDWLAAFRQRVKDYLGREV